MKFIADLHIHSKYSRATSGKMNVDELSESAKVKGVNILGTGDFTHPKHLADLKIGLEDAGNGVFKKNGVNFILSTEIANLFTWEHKGRKVHNVILAPSFEIVDQINESLLKWGRLDYDGRPMFGKTCVELMDLCASISKDIAVIPAHCLKPSTFLHCNPHDKRIEEIKEGDKVLTHNGRFEKVLQVYQRSYVGNMYKIVPWYFREGIVTTPEHPFLAIKSFKKCPSTKGTCKSLCSKRTFCKKRAYVNYTPAWIQAKDFETGDFLLYPRPTKTKDIRTICMTNLLDCKRIGCGTIIPKTSQNKRNPINDVIKINDSFCRLAGYYAAEGYLISNEAVGFSFNAKEKEYIDDVINLMKMVFGICKFKIDSRRKKQGDIIFFSHVLNSFFKKMFYCSNETRAWNKCIPDWMILLPKEKLAELLRGWWRGDMGYTVSRKLANQMKMVCLKLGIIPSIAIDTAKNFNARGKHFIDGRKIVTSRDTFIFSNLSFFENDYGLLKEHCFRKFINKRASKHGWLDTNYVYLPVRKITKENYKGVVFNLEVAKDNSYVTEYAAVHNCWTPWFAVFGSNSGFDRLEDCFQSHTKDIFAIETGMSSDPAMNWRLSALDKVSLVSFSDAHSPYPWRLGREACAFDLEKPDYFEMMKAIRAKDKDRFLYTIETDPAYGKYHYDGHRACNTVLSPEEAKKYNNICPVCRRQLTIGVAHRVEELADRPIGFVPKEAIPFKTLLSLSEIIAGVFNTAPESKTVYREFNQTIKALGDELSILLDLPEERLRKEINGKVVDTIMKGREGKIKIKPGYDGVYGEPVFEESETVSGPKRQKSLLDY